jgi:type IV secretory pathway VirB4 component
MRFIRLLPHVSGIFVINLHKGDGKRVHDFLTEEEWTGSFIVLGTTGSGKTTLIKYVHTQSKTILS